METDADVEEGGKLPDFTAELEKLIRELSQPVLGVADQACSDALRGDGAQALGDFVDDAAPLLILAASTEDKGTSLHMQAVSGGIEIASRIKGGSCAIVIAKSSGRFDRAMPLSSQLLVITLPSENLVESLLACMQKSLMPLLEVYFAPGGTRMGHLDAGDRISDTSLAVDPVAATLVRKKVCAVFFILCVSLLVSGKKVFQKNPGSKHSMR
jgi:hypothetical protein